MSIQEDWTLPGAPDDPSRGNANLQQYERSYQELLDKHLAALERIGYLEAALSQETGAREELEEQNTWFRGHCPQAWRDYQAQF